MFLNYPSAPVLPLSEKFLQKLLVQELLQLGLLQSWPQLVGFPSQYIIIIFSVLCPTRSTQIQISTDFGISSCLR